MHGRLVRSVVLAATAGAGMLVMTVAGPDARFSTAEATAVAVLALLLALPLVDSALFGSSVRPETAGVCLGLPVGFLFRQSSISEALASGADRVLVAALAVSLALAAFRWLRRRRHAQSA